MFQRSLRRRYLSWKHPSELHRVDQERSEEGGRPPFPPPPHNGDLKLASGVFKKSSGIWSWITDKLGLRKEVTSNIQDFDADSVAIPWHLLQISEDDLLVADRNFETPWILRMSTGGKQDIRNVFCDTDGQRVLKHNLDTKNTSNIHFSNCEVLGLPYWFVCNLERVSTW